MVRYFKVGAEFAYELILIKGRLFFSILKIQPGSTFNEYNKSTSNFSFLKCATDGKSDNYRD